MNKQPLLILAICFILGIIFQDRISMNESWVYGVTAGSFVSVILLFFQSYFLHTIRKLLLGVLFFASGIILHFYQTSSFEKEILPQRKEMVVFSIVQKLNSTEKYKKYIGKVQAGNNLFYSVIYLPKISKEPDFAHYYKGNAYITNPGSPQHDFQFDYAQYLQRRNIKHQVFISEEISSATREDVSFEDKIRQYRLMVLQKIDRSRMTVKTKEFLKGIILSDRTEIDAITAEDFNKSGLVHFLAISGTHIVVIFGMFYFLLIRIIPLRFRKYVVVLSLLFIWLFAAFIGFGNSVLRACIMLSVYFIFVLLQRKPDLLHSLALSALIILIADTQQLFEVGFQLSYMAVFGIFWLNQPLLKHFPKQDNYFKKLLYNTVTISLSAQIATLPLVLYYFHQFSFISIIANFLIVPFSEVIIVFSFLMTVLIIFGFDFQWISFIYDMLIRILLQVIHWFAEMDTLFFESIPMSLMEVFAILITVYLLRFAIVKCNLKYVMRVSLAFLFFLMIRSGYSIYENQRDEILFLDSRKNKVFVVKQGNKACFWMAENTNRKKIEQFIIKPYCSSRRIVYSDIKTYPLSAQKIVFKNRRYALK